MDKKKIKICAHVSWRPVMNTGDVADVEELS